MFLLFSNTIRETRLGALDTTADSDDTRKMLGSPNRTFSFVDLKNSIDFVDCSASIESNNYKSILNWIDTVV